MGQGVIVSNETEGLYTVRLTYHELDVPLAKLADRRAILETELPILRNEVAKLADEAIAYRIALDLLIQQWIDGTLEDEKSSDKTDILDLVNDLRAENGLPPVSYESTLEDAAQGHAEDMVNTNTVGHTGSDGSAPRDRMRAAGWGGPAYGENVTSGPKSALEAFTAWKNSPKHLANMLNPAFTKLGVGAATNPSSTYGSAWAQNFG